eukprot:6376745-Prymnesium_polylepis.6
MAATHCAKPTTAFTLHRIPAFRLRGGRRSKRQARIRVFDRQYSKLVSTYLVACAYQILCALLKISMKHARTLLHFGCFSRARATTALAASKRTRPNRETE